MHSALYLPLSSSDHPICSFLLPQEENRNPEIIIKKYFVKLFITNYSLLINPRIFFSIQVLAAGMPPAFQTVCNGFLQLNYKKNL
jgi:hypothetical protein